MHQYLFFIGDFPIRMYGLMLCTAIFLATGTAYFLEIGRASCRERV